MKLTKKELNNENKRLKELSLSLYCSYIDMMNTFNYLQKYDLFEYYLKRLNNLERKYNDFI